MKRRSQKLAEDAMIKIESKVYDVKTAIGAAGDNQTKIEIAKGVGQCDGWADNGSEHRNSGNGCFILAIMVPEKDQTNVMDKEMAYFNTKKWMANLPRAFESFSRTNSS